MRYQHQLVLFAKRSSYGCDAGCVALVETVGFGPEDPFADAVASACPGLCSAALGAASGEAYEVVLLCYFVKHVSSFNRGSFS